MTQPGRAFFSGYNGGQRFGIPTVTVGTEQSLKLGGNGILPGSRISFQAWNRNTRQGAGVNARSRAHLHDQAVYFPGNQPWMSVVDQVVNLNVVYSGGPTPPTPDPDEGQGPIDPAPNPDVGYGPRG